VALIIIKTMTMKLSNISGWLLLLFAGTAITACSKEMPVPQTAIITVANAMGGAYALQFGEASTNEPLSYNVSRRYTSHKGNFHFTPFLRDETTYEPIKPALYELNIPVALNSIQTLFLAGNLHQPDTFLVKDEPLTFAIEDSSMSFRFVNLSPGSAPVNVNLQGKASGSEVASLSYKNITAFRKYKADASISQYVFEFRDAATEELLTTLSVDGINAPGNENAPNLWRRRNFTIVFDGNPGTAQEWPQTAFIVNYN
jgi:hypothetical protein